MHKEVKPLDLEKNKQVKQMLTVFRVQGPLPVSKSFRVLNLPLVPRLIAWISGRLPCDAQPGRGWHGIFRGK